METEMELDEEAKINEYSDIQAIGAGKFATVHRSPRSSCPPTPSAAPSFLNRYLVSSIVALSSSSFPCPPLSPTIFFTPFPFSVPARPPFHP